MYILIDIRVENKAYPRNGQYSSRFLLNKINRLKINEHYE